MTATATRDQVESLVRTIILNHLKGGPSADGDGAAKAAPPALAASRPVPPAWRAPGCCEIRE